MGTPGRAADPDYYLRTYRDRLTPYLGASYKSLEQLRPFAPTLALHGDIPREHSLNDQGQLVEQNWFQKYKAPLLIGAGAFAAPFVAGSIGSLLAGGGASSAAPAAASTAGTVAAPAAATAATTGGAMNIGSMLLNYGLPAGIQGVANYFSGRAQGKAAEKAAALEAQAAAATLAFLREQEATRRQEWQQTQDRNYGLFREREARLAPYRQFGAGAIGQLAQPIPGVGTVRSLMR